MKNFYEAVKERRSIYGISKEITVSQDRIVEIVQEAAKHAPSAFNSQSGRAVVLFGDQHDKLWSIVRESLRKIVPSDKFAPTEEKISSFQGGYGTVLFFDDSSIVEGLQNRFPLYQENFPVWAQQSNGMLQYIVWTALELEGLGASLQHYNPLIDDEVKKSWNLPEHWKLIAQMPFGKPTIAPGEKEFLPIEDRVKIFG